MKKILVTLFLFALAAAGAGEPSPRRVAATPWPQNPDGRHYGNHRAVVTVATAAPAVVARLDWRRPDLDPAGHDVRIVSRGDGKLVAHHRILAADNESGTVMFGPVTPGEYEIYYFPFDWPEPAVGAPTIAYCRPAPDPDWPGPTVDPATLPEAKVECFEARSEHDSFSPMEVIATRDELADLGRRFPDNVLLFPESRRRPIRMRRYLPQCWTVTGPDNRFADTANPNEYFTWQLGVYPATGDVTVTRVEFSDLTGPDGHAIPAAAQVCFNLTGSDCRGRDFTQTMPVKEGEVGALWCGVDLPGDIAPGCYRGVATVHTAESGAIPVDFELTVAGPPLADRGDAESWRMSRLRWLNSKLGLGDVLVAPFTAPRRDGNTIDLKNRRLVIGDDGFPVSIAVKSTELLAAPVHFAPWRNGAELPLADTALQFTAAGESFIEWEFVNRYAGVEISGRARLEQDGYLDYRLRLKALAAFDLDDAALEIRQTPETSRYMSGLDFKGGYTPEQYRWRWDSAPHNNFNSQWWLGIPDAGLWGKLADAQDSWMEGAIQAVGATTSDGYPAAWYNGGRGGIAIDRNEAGTELKAFSGQRSLQTGDTVEFRFGLLVTPAKEPDPRHFARRYYTREQPPAATAAATGSNIMTLFHGHPALAYINTPFATIADFDAVVADARHAGIRTAGYHTTGQVSTSLPELWAMRAMPDAAPIFPGGDTDTKGFSWDCEHLGNRFKCGWLQCLYNGIWDSAIITGGTSRYQNFYAESLRWLVGRGLGGIYLDGFGADRSTARRINYALKLADPDAAIDLHVGNARVPWHGGLQLSEMCRNAENIVYFDSTWAGESYDFSMPPDQWLTEASGLIYGVYGDMLNDPNTKPNLWRGMLYGMATRYYTFVPAAPTGFWSVTNWSDPAPVWKLWDDFGIADATLRGYWRDDCPVKTGRDDILASVYAKPESALIVLGSWSGASSAVKRAVMGRSGNPARLAWFTPLGGAAGDARDLGTEVALAYDDDNLYVDYQVTSPAPPRRKVQPGSEGPVWEDDSIELYFEAKPDAWHSRIIQIVVNGNGAVLARDLSDPARTVPCQVKAGPASGNSWSGALTIPWKSLGGAPLSDGGEIAFNLCRNQVVEGASQENFSWSPTVGVYSRSSGFGRLTLGGPDAAPTVETGGPRPDASRRATDTVRLAIDWSGLGFSPDGYELYQPAMAGMQPERHYAPDAALDVPVDQGLFLILRKK